MNLTVLALSAQAAYLDWQSLESNRTVLTADTYGFKNRLSAGAADLFLSAYSYAGTGAHQANTESGFSATVFTPVNAGTPYIFAARGTEFPSVDLYADADLASFGYAGSQIVDGYIYLKICATKAGDPVSFSADERAALLAVWPRTPSDLNDKLNSVFELGTGVLCPETGTVSVDFTGHSLGGHLTANLADLASQFLSNRITVDQVVTFNGAGFGGLPADFDWTGNTTIAKEPSHILDELTHVIATDGLSVTATLGSTPGQKVMVNIEGGPLWADDHSIVQLATGVALQEFLVSHGLTADQASSLLDASSAQETGSYEALLKWVSAAVIADGNVCPALGGTDVFADVATLNLALGSAQLLDLMGLSPAALATFASQDAGAQQALEDLRPLVLTSNPNPVASLTDQWIADRSKLLQAIVVKNTQDIPDGTDVLDQAAPEGLALEFKYRDSANQEKSLLTVRPGLFEAPKQFIRFGGNGDDPIDGTSYPLGDHLYGGGGNDTIRGFEGNDYLEGNAGNDILDGGTGADTMVGGTGNDTYFVDNSGDVVTELAGADGGIDTVHISSTAALTNSSYWLRPNVEKLIADPGAQVFELGGNDGDNVITGNESTQLIFGGVGADTLWAGAVDTVLNGGTENDILNGFTGNDTLNAGTGYDTILFARGDGNDTLTLGSGNDTLKLLASAVNTTLVGELLRARHAVNESVFRRAA